MATQERFMHLPGNWSDTQRKLAFTAIGVVLALVADAFYGRGFIPSGIALIVYFFAGFTLSITVTLGLTRGDPRKPDYIDSNILLVMLVGVLAIMYFFSWYWPAAAALCLSFVNRESSSALRFRDWGWYYLGGLGVVIIAQFWLNTSIINTMGSDEDLLGNRRIQELAPLISAIGFAVFAIRLIPARGTLVVAVFILSSVVFYNFQTFAIDLWARQQTQETQERAIVAHFGKLAAVNQMPWLISDEQRTSPDRFRLLASLAPAKAMLSDDISTLDYALNEAGPEHVLHAMRIEMIRPGSGQQRGQELIKQARSGYESYLSAFMLRMDNETTARALAQQHYPAILKTRAQPLTRGGIADEVIRRVIEEVPQNRRSASGYRHVFSPMRGRGRLVRSLVEEGIHLPEDWQFTTMNALRSDVISALLSSADTAERRVARRISGTPSSIASRQVGGTPFMTWEDYTEKGLGISLPLGENPVALYSVVDYHSDLRHMFKHSSSEPLMRMARRFLTERYDTSVAIKAAMIPAVVIISSFGVMLLNLFALWAGLWERYGHHARRYTPEWLTNLFSGVNHIGWMMFGGMIIGLFITNGPTGTYLNWQETSAAAGNRIFNSLGIPTTLSDRPQGNGHRVNLAEHHLARAQSLINGNRQLEYTFAYPLFHIDMALYYEPDSRKKAQDLGLQIARIYMNHGSGQAGAEHHREFRRDLRHIRSRIGLN